MMGRYLPFVCVWASSFVFAASESPGNAKKLAVIAPLNANLQPYIKGAGFDYSKRRIFFKQSEYPGSEHPGVNALKCSYLKARGMQKKTIQQRYARNEKIISVRYALRKATPDAENFLKQVSDDDERRVSDGYLKAILASLQPKPVLPQSKPKPILGDDIDELLRCVE